jgi:arylsulfatase A-like enzyme
MPGRYFPDLMVEEATQFIEQHRAQPFFIYFALNMPHYPYQGETKWLERFKELPYPRNLYAAFLASCDERIGALLRKVDDTGLRERTIVVFQSDNGHSTEERAHFGGGSAGMYRGQKFSLFEGGIRLPAIVSWPGQLPAGETRGQLAHSCDWLPTLAELTGVRILNADLDGKSLAPVLRTAAAPSPHEVLHWQVGGGIRPQWAVRQGDWKLIGNVQSTPDPALTAEDKREFLSNLAADPGEKTNWIQRQSEIAARLRKLHAEWLAANKSSLPPADTATKDKEGNEK